MKPFIAYTFVAFLSVALAIPQDLTSKWKEFKAKHGKQHPSHEEAERMQRFAERHAEIEAHNARYAAGLESFSRQLNHYSDLSDKELEKHAFAFISDVDDAPVPWNNSNVLPSLPASFDWRDRGVITPPRNQMQCGACYAFASIGLLEAHIKMKTREEFDFSEQDIIDCSFKKFRDNKLNQGCHGGSPSAVFEYVNGSGVALELSYPYTSGNSRREGTCHSDRVDSLRNRKPKLIHVKVKNEDELAQLLFSKGPLVVVIGVDREEKRILTELGNGIFDVPCKSSLIAKLYVLLVGYGNKLMKKRYMYYNKPFWVIKNSWGTGWGVGGYGKLARGKNMATILQEGAWYLES